MRAIQIARFFVPIIFYIMKLWRFSLWLSIISCLLLAIVFLIPSQYRVFIWREHGVVDAGVLFPLLLLSWTTALAGFALNNIFIDRTITDAKIKMTDFIKAVPSLLGLPAFFSFVWFIFRWYKGDPHR